MFPANNARSGLRSGDDVVGRHARSDEHAPGHLGAGADHGVTSKDRGPRIDHDLVLEHGMTLTSLDDSSLSVARETASAQGDPLVELASITDATGLADHDTGAVVDEEASADRRRRVDLDARPRARRLA